jgi:hypothetical protein
MKARTLIVLIFFAALASSCAADRNRDDGRYATFANALGACRQEQRVPLRRRFTLPPTHPQVSNCLKQHGWNPDGTRR